MTGNMEKERNNGFSEAVSLPELNQDPSGTSESARVRPLSRVSSVSLQGQTDKMAESAQTTHVGAPKPGKGWGGYKIPRNQRDSGGDPRLEGMSSSDADSDDSSVDMDTGNRGMIFGPGWSSSGTNNGPSATWTPMSSGGRGFGPSVGESRNSTIAEASIYDPLAERKQRCNWSKASGLSSGSIFMIPNTSPNCWTRSRQSAPCQTKLTNG